MERYRVFLGRRTIDDLPPVQLPLCWQDEMPTGSGGCQAEHRLLDLLRGLENPTTLSPPEWRELVEWQRMTSPLLGRHTGGKRQKLGLKVPQPKSQGRGVGRDTQPHSRSMSSCGDIIHRGRGFVNG